MGGEFKGIRGVLDLLGSTVLVTGATGFLGCRLAEYLSLGLGVKVKAVVRDFASPGMPRLARLPVEVISGDLLHPAMITPAVTGCEYIVHCAYGNRGDEKTRRKVTVEGTRNLLEAARRLGVRKFVHVSTATVHGTPRGEVVHEDYPYQYSGQVYYDSKIDAEKLALSYYRRFGLPISILRPARIFGPWSEYFTIQIINDVKNKATTLIDEGKAKANVVYVDNVVEAILLCLTKPESTGAAFLVNGDEKITWREFYKTYADMVRDVPPLQSVTIDEIKRYRRRSRLELVTTSVKSSWRLLTGGMRRFYQEVPLVQISANSLSSKLPRRVEAWLQSRFADSESSVGSPDNVSGNGRVDSVQPLPQLWSAKAMASDCWFSTEKIKLVLGYTQKTSFQEGMRLTRQWLEWCRLI